MNYLEIEELSRTFNVSREEIETLVERARQISWEHVLAKFDLTISHRRPKTDAIVLLCPFHQEKTPSFQIWINDSRRYHCHGCKNTGTMLEFVIGLSRAYMWEEVVKFFDSPTFMPLSKDDPHQLWLPGMETPADWLPAMKPDDQLMLF